MAQVAPPAARHQLGALAALRTYWSVVLPLGVTPVGQGVAEDAGALVGALVVGPELALVVGALVVGADVVGAELVGADVGPDDVGELGEVGEVGDVVEEGGDVCTAGEGWCPRAGVTGLGDTTL